MTVRIIMNSFKLTISRETGRLLMVNTSLVNSFKLYPEQRYYKMLYMQNNRNKILQGTLILFWDYC